MMICPNKNLAEWKHLESFQGAAKALMLWDYFKGNVPLEAYKDKNFKIPSIGKTVNKLTEDSIKDSGILPELSISFNKPLDEIVHLYKQFIESKISIGTLENVSVENGIVTSNEKGTISALINIIGAKTFETEQDYIDEIKAFLGLTYYPNKTEINEFNKEFTKDNSIIIRETNEIIASENNIIKPFESATIQQFKNTIELGSANSYSNEIKSGVAEIFKSNPELVAIGTQEQYSQYLDTIFPDSKVKDIVYHGTKELNKVKEEGFDTSKIGTGESTSLQGKGFYFAKHPHILKSYAKGERGGIISALLNVENPLQEKKFTKFLREQLGINNVDASNVYEVGNKVTKWLEDNNKDSVLWEQGQTIPKGTEQQEDNIKRIFGNYFDFSTRLLNSPHYSVIKPEQIHILGSKQDIQGFKDFVNNQNVFNQESINNIQDNFDPQLAQKIQDKLQKLYPEIKLTITNNPIWEKADNVFNQKEYNNQVNYRLKITEKILDNLTKIKQWESNKSIDKNTLWKKIQDFGVSKQQLNLLKESEGNTVEEKLTSFITNYSYTIEINTAKEYSGLIKDGSEFYVGEDYYYSDPKNNVYKILYNVEKGGGSKTISKEEFEKARKDGRNSSYYSNLTVPGGTNYTENEIATPLITPSIKGHAQFATDNGIGWFRSDDFYFDRVIKLSEGITFNNLNYYIDGKIKARRIFELQSDLFQKGRNELNLIVEELESDIDFNKDLKNRNLKKEIIGEVIEGYGKVVDIYLDNDFKDLDVFRIVTDSGEKFGAPLYYFDSVDNRFKEKLSKVIKESEKKILQRTQFLQLKNLSSNQFLQLLNKDNNWVTFFIKSIIQDSAKKGYEKVLFPTGNTASKVEGHTTLEEFKKQKEDRIKELETSSILKNKTVDGFYYIQRYLEDENGNEVLTWRKVSNETGREKTATIEEINELKERFSDETKNEINQLKQELERVETEGFGALKPIYNFYENTVANILNKQGYNSQIITDEYGNTWNEIIINQARDLNNILLQKNEANKIIGQANIKAMTVLIDAVNQKQDTLSHEYAHHYIAWFRDTPIVQEAIKKWGSEEALVQSIGEQVVKQKGEAYNWWNKFVKWIMNQFNSLSKLQKEELTQILTDAFLTRQDLSSKQDRQGLKEFVNKNKTIDELNKEIKNIIEERKVKDQNSIETEQKLKAEETKMLNDYFDNLGMVQYNTGTFTKIVRSAVETTKIVPPATQFKFYKNPVKTVDVTENGKYKVSISFTTVNPNSSIKELRQQGLAKYPADAVKQDVKDPNFLDALADNEFEGLSGKFKEVYKRKLEDGEYQLGCKI